MRAPPPNPLIQAADQGPSTWWPDRAVSRVPRVKMRAATIMLVRTDQ